MQHQPHRPTFTAPRTGEVFNPASLLHAAREQWADRPERIALLARCTRHWQESAAYTHFHDHEAEALHAPRWRHAGGYWLQCPVHGELLIDFCTRINDPHRMEVSGIEFMDRLAWLAVD
ncbi:MAG: hypothetical protein IPJ76_06605 [Flavobacteriales bacterium]|nr:MAG: hypothetical protein IPJ76_06605 [Flavobacteriales bacterium]